MSQQDDKQLRELVEDLIYSFTDDDRAIQPDRPYKLYDKDSAIAAIQAYVASAQIQLVSELEGELPEKEPVVAPIGLHELEAELNDEYRGHNKAIDKVTALLEHKKQELEGKQ